ncbi:hypothetical protein [Celeribacter sp. SCSIO 80788]|uniref:hypothetical protein n=1 Tax=Celeribacter sp. SCSIO 80788 TaxID=3117013 RepID=UPI003DA3934D
MQQDIILYGLGAMGRRIARLVIERGHQIVGAIDLDPAKKGTSLHDLLEMPEAPDLTISDDAEAVLAAHSGAVVLQATASFLHQVAGAIETCLSHGHDVISIAEEMTFPEAADADLAARLDMVAKAHGRRVLGTGVNPGFAMDMLVLALTVPCGRVDHIRAIRTNDLSDFGPSVLQSQGVGLTEAEFTKALAAGTVVGHVGFAQSVALIAGHLGWRIDRVEETRMPILSKVARETPWLTIAPGQVAGCLHCITGYSDGREVLRLEHPQQIRPEAEDVKTSDRIVITGDQTLDMVLSPEIGGGAGTAAAAVNAVAYLHRATPGLVHLTDLPLTSPRAPQPQEQEKA